jgi:hypothetical protein
VERGGLSRTDYVTDGIVSLPIYESLTDATVEQIAYAIQRIARFKATKKQTLDNKEYQHVAAGS